MRIVVLDLRTHYYCLLCCIIMVIVYTRRSRKTILDTEICLVDNIVFVIRSESFDVAKREDPTRNSGCRPISQCFCSEYALTEKSVVVMTSDDTSRVSRVRLLSNSHNFGLLRRFCQPREEQVFVYYDKITCACYNK